VDVVLVVRVLAAVAIVVSVCCGTTALIERGRVPRCVYAALPAYTRPIVRLRGPSCVNAGKCVNAHPRCVYVRKCVYANAGCVYARGVFMHPGAYTRDSAFTRAGGAYTLRVRIRTRVRIRGWVYIRERWVHLRSGCVHAPGCVYAGGCVYASGSTYTQRVRIRTPSRIHKFLRIRTPDRVNAGNDKP
jgi:hypothetical protein